MKMNKNISFFHFIYPKVFHVFVKNPKDLYFSCLAIMTLSTMINIKNTYTLDCTEVVAGSQILNYLRTQKIHRAKRPKNKEL